MNKDLLAIFAQHNLRLTTARTEVFNTLLNTHSPLSIVQIAQHTPSVDKVSVYRTVKLFDDIGIITTSTRGWKHSYELAEPFIPHHHHMICNNCGIIIEIKSDKIENLINTVSTAHNFTPTSHHFELRGLCRNCTR